MDDAAQHGVVIAGGGPTGLMLAAELTLAGADVVVVERRQRAQFDGSRAGGLHARTLEVLDQRGVGDRFVEAGQVMQTAGFGGAPLDLGDAPTRRNHGVALWQRETERILGEWVLGDLGVPIIRERDVVGFAPDERGVTVELSDGSTLRAAYLAGCDGGRSTVRKAAGIDFPGLDPTTIWIMAEIAMTEPPPLGMRPEGGGIGPVVTDGVVAEGRYGVVVRQPWVDGSGDPTLDDLRHALVDVYGSDFGTHDPTRLSRFTDTTRQAATYRSGRVVLAGDAAHIHPPQGGQGLNVGIQDAVNLGWKLAQVVAGTSPDTLLDTYHAERHPVGERLLRNSRAQVALQSADPLVGALRDVLGEVLGTDQARRHVAAMMSGLDIRYDLGDGHPLVGRRMPDLDLLTEDGATTVFALLHDARPLLLGVGATPIAVAGPDRLRVVAASTDGPWELPVVGAVAAPDAVLVRPDGHVAWVGERHDPSLTDAVAQWFGDGLSR